MSDQICVVTLIGGPDAGKQIATNGYSRVIEMPSRDPVPLGLTVFDGEPGPPLVPTTVTYQVYELLDTDGSCHQIGVLDEHEHPVRELLKFYAEHHKEEG